MDPVAVDEHRIGPYKIIGAIGHGGMGSLCVATREGVRGFSKVVALKRILPEHARKPRFREMFLDEARTSALLDHPNIVATYELSEFDGEYVIAMEYLPGEDLGAVLRQARAYSTLVPIDIALFVAVSCARGLQFAHALTDRGGAALNLVHRDVNPANIMLTYHGTTKLLDFGVARTRVQSIQTMTGGFKGKMRYASPEQLRGESIEGNSDVFSLAIVLWESLTGQPLFRAPNDLAVIEAVRSRPIVPPSQLRPEVPPALDEVVLRALSRDPKERFANARAFGDALTNVAFITNAEERLANWLRALFGAERAALKLDVAHGRELSGSVERLIGSRPDSRGSSVRSTGGDQEPRRRPRTVWSTDLPTPADARDAVASEPRPFTSTIDLEPSMDLRTEDVFPNAASGRRTRYGVVALLALATAAVAAYLGWVAPAATTSASTTASITVRSTPSGAQIFVDGAPTGYVTPATLGGLVPDRPLDVRVVKRGFAPAVRVGEPGETLVVELERNVGMVVVRHAPSESQLFIDGVSVGAVAPVEVGVGQHEIRVEHEGRSILERVLRVSADGVELDARKGENR